MQLGFASWQKKDFNAFVSGCAKYGRHNLASVAQEVEGKSEKEVAQYAVTFFKRFNEIKEWEKHIKKIEAGERKIQARFLASACCPDAL